MSLFRKVTVRHATEDKAEDHHSLVLEFSERVLLSATGMTWESRVELFDDFYVHLRQNLPQKDLPGAIFPRIVENVINALGVQPVVSLAQARIYANSASVAHRDLAQEWLRSPAPPPAEPQQPVSPQARLYLGKDATVLQSDLVSQRILDSSDGLAVRSGKLVAERANDSAAIARLVNEAITIGKAAFFSEIMIVPRRSRRVPFILSISSVPSAYQARHFLQSVAAAAIVDCAALPPDAAATWRKALGLTAAEARLMAQFVTKDGDVRTASAGANMAYETARVHLRAVYKKTGTNSQAQLLHLLLAVAQSAASALLREPNPSSVAAR